MPIYKVTSPAGTRLVRASHQSVAVNHVVNDTVKAKSVTASELHELLGSGLVVETASQAKEVAA